MLMSQLIENAGLTSMGMDSLMAVEFRNRIIKHWEIHLVKHYLQP